MISTTWTAAPAGFLGLGGSDARPCAPGTAVPFGGSTVDGMTGRLRLRTDDLRAFLPSNGQQVTERLVVEVHVQKPIAPTTGTTLGIPSSRRPAS
jgi:hypothetical protein